MNIIRLEIENHKAIKCFHLDANGKNIEISGDTATGKTTAISALWDILSKGKDVLKHGEKKGAIRVSIGDETGTHYIAERVTTPSKSTVSIFKMIGNKPLPIDMKDFEAMLSTLSVNPHKIKDMKPTERIKTLMAAADCDIDLDAMDQEIEQAEQERTLAGRAAKGSKPVAVPEKTEPVSVSELIAERDKLTTKNQKVLTGQARHKELISEKARVAEEITALEAKLTELRANAESIEGSLRTAEGWLKEHTIIPTDSLDQQIANAEETNKRAAVYEQAIKDQETYEGLQEHHRKADEKVKSLREAKKAALESVVWPLDGLAVEEGEIVYNGILLGNLGESEQMLVTSAIALGDIEKHELKVVRLDGIESMSKADYEKLRAMFNERGVQVLSTRVSRGDAEDHEITITEGEYSE